MLKSARHALVVLCRRGTAGAEPPCLAHACPCRQDPPPPPPPRRRGRGSWRSGSCAGDLGWAAVSAHMCDTQSAPFHVRVGAGVRSARRRVRASAAACAPAASRCTSAAPAAPAGTSPPRSATPPCAAPRPRVPPLRPRVLPPLRPCVLPPLRPCVLPPLRPLRVAGWPLALDAAWPLGLECC